MRSRPALELVALLLCGANLFACASWLPTPVPMKAIDHRAAPTPAQSRAKCLLVFLPGRGDSAEDFADKGFVAEVTRRKLSIDMVAADATLGYYANGVLTERLYTDVVQPRLARKYEQVWLVGMSMGGLGTLMYSRQRPSAEITGVLALAPYLGDSDLHDEIRAAGGLAKWKAPARVTTLNADNYQSELFRWLQAVTAGREPGPIIHLAYGDDDRLAKADSLLAAVLPNERVYTGAGEHNWVTWRALFQRFLDSSALMKDCAAPSSAP